MKYDNVCVSFSGHHIKKVLKNSVFSSPFLYLKEQATFCYDGCHVILLSFVIPMPQILRTGDTDDLALDQTLEIDVWVCRDKIRRTDIEFICDTVKRIPSPDNITACVFSAAVAWNIDIRPRLQAFGINFRVYPQDAFYADTKLAGYFAYGITRLD